MKGKNHNKTKPLPQRGAKKGTKKRLQDPFFETEPKRRRNFEDEEILSSGEDSDDDSGRNDAGEAAEAEEEEEETAAEKRKRVAEEYLDKIRVMAKRQEEEEDGDDEGLSGDERRVREGERDSRVASILQQEQLEDSGRVRRLLASSNDEFLSGSDDGSIEQWSVLRKKPAHIVRNAHALLTPQKSERREKLGLSNGHIDNGVLNSEDLSSSAHSWVGSVAVCRSSDLAASGAGNGSVRLWEIKSDSKGIQPLFELPLVGFVNSMAFAKSGKFLVAGVGQEGDIVVQCAVCAPRGFCMPVKSVPLVVVQGFRRDLQEQDLEPESMQSFIHSLEFWREKGFRSKVVIAYGAKRAAGDSFCSPLLLSNVLEQFIDSSLCPV
ncbi:hypothetical protein RJ640_018014 [Escallonia rubra]|uniref:U3 snoRNP-associated protein-like EMB2271 n=1 Tax=Escallonia rubra TaxID=112253 RepID=A0AA88RSB6_9ASTE|nr:hypothetical protein RJ640_018014 [Escallonia rubra]